MVQSHMEYVPELSYTWYIWPSPLLEDYINACNHVQVASILLLNMSRMLRKLGPLARIPTFPSLLHRPPRGGKGDVDASNSFSEKALSMTRNCAEVLRLCAGAVPGCGTQIQALVDIGLVLLDRIEQIRAWEGVKDELCRKINYVFGMVRTALAQSFATQASGLETDLLEIEEVLRGINQFVEQRSNSKGRKILRIMTCKSDYNHIVTFGARIDEAVRNLTIKPLIQLRLDIAHLKSMVQSSVDDAAKGLKESLKSSTEDLQKELRSSAEDIKGVLDGVFSRVEARTSSTSSVDVLDTTRVDPDACTTHYQATLERKGPAWGIRRWNTVLSCCKNPVLGRRTTVDEEPGGIVHSYSLKDSYGMHRP